ncbi:hypothetical protein HDV05_008312 [Chytridiales sp. JEL 0842]|nr:hypothetical protein HDV05_008312 [Chytridiales sp. JEL 0842]
MPFKFKNPFKFLKKLFKGKSKKKRDEQPKEAPPSESSEAPPSAVVEVNKPTNAQSMPAAAPVIVPLAVPAVTEVAEKPVEAVVEVDSDVKAVSPTELVQAPLENIEVFSRGFCPFTQMIRLALNIKDVKYTFTRWGPNDTPPEWFKSASPEGTVPVLRKPDGSYLADSEDMITWLNEQVPTPNLYPYENAKEWETFARTDLVPAFLKVLMAANPAIQAEFRPKLKAAVEKLVAHRKTHSGKYLLSDEFTAADLVLSPILRRHPLIKYFRGLDISSPELEQYIQSLETNPHFSPIAWPIENIRKALITMLPKMKPMSAGRLQHIAIRKQFEKAVSLVRRLTDESLSDEEALAVSKDVTRRVSTLILFVQEHASFEEEVIYPVFEEMQPGSTKRAHEEHEHEVPILEAFKADFEGALADVESSGSFAASAKEQFGARLDQLVKMQQGMDEHMAGEEKELFPMTNQLGEKEVPTFRKIYYHCCHVREILLPFVMEFLSPQERMQYMHNIGVAVRESDPAQWELCGNILKKSLPSDEWEDLKERLPTLVATA